MNIEFSFKASNIQAAKDGVAKRVEKLLEARGEGEYLNSVEIEFTSRALVREDFHKISSHHAYKNILSKADELDRKLEEENGLLSGEISKNYDEKMENLIRKRLSDTTLEPSFHVNVEVEISNEKDW